MYVPIYLAWIREKRRPENFSEIYLNIWSRNNFKNHEKSEKKLWVVDARKQSGKSVTRSFVDKLVFTL